MGACMWKLTEAGLLCRVWAEGLEGALGDGWRKSQLRVPAGLGPRALDPREKGAQPVWGEWESTRDGPACCPALQEG